MLLTVGTAVAVISGAIGIVGVGFQLVDAVLRLTGHKREPSLIGARLISASFGGMQISMGLVVLGVPAWFAIPASVLFLGVGAVLLGLAVRGFRVEPKGLASNQ